MRDPYDVLGVAKSASAKEIKTAFRKLAKQHHPDQNPNDPKAKEKFAAANQAYEILGDEKVRGAYDRGEIDGDGKPRFQGFEGSGFGQQAGDPFAAFRRAQGGQGPGDGQFEFRSSGGNPLGGDDDIFSQLFGGATRQRGRPSKGADINVDLAVSVEEMAAAEKVNALFPDGRRVAVKLPAYVENGQTIRLRGQGEQGPAGAGDALVTVKLRKHPRYRVEGRDLHVDLPVPLREAVLGAKVPVETPTGKIAVTVSPWSNSDKVLRLKGKGLPAKTGGHADLYVHIRVMLPEQPDPSLEAFFTAKAR